MKEEKEGRGEEREEGEERGEGKSEREGERRREGRGREGGGRGKGEREGGQREYFCITCAHPPPYTLTIKDCLWYLRQHEDFVARMSCSASA